MLEIILCTLVIYLLYKLFTTSRKTYVENKQGYKVLPMSAFDAYLIQRHKESEENAKLIPNVVFPVSESPQVVINNNISAAKPTKVKKEIKEYTLAEEIYLGALKEPGRYPTDDIRREALQEFKCTEEQLNDMVANFKIDKRKKRN